MHRTVVLIGTVASLLMAGCSSTPSGTVPPQDAEGRYIVAMTSSLEFEPGKARVPVGATVVWVNNATMAHDVSGYRGDPIESEYAEFSSEDEPPKGVGRLMEPGDELSHTFSAKGTWTIWCHTHHEERMKQIIYVG